MKEKLVFALDVPSYEEAEALVKELKDYVGVFKVGKELFTATGPKIFQMIKDNGGKVFADLKYHDIPNTVASAARVLVKQGVDIFNVHSTGGYEMMKKTSEAIKDEAEKLGIEKPIMLAVTVLTSLSNEDLQNIKVNLTTEEYVLELAKLAKKSGADGVVCSPKEITLIKENLGTEFMTLTPGIRPAWSETGDQKRIMTPRQAVEQGTDFIVVGRPIKSAENRKEAAQKILEEMEG